MFSANDLSQIMLPTERLSTTTPFNRKSYGTKKPAPWKGNRLGEVQYAF
ncbi:hypothetical protein CLV60_10918 [Dyadobacter jiangsuensis]|uniref:Uncharacterized protein n=1 Tax=Dyadobacter jiangsuensis TaxID=1591085 RepID=A0A2P8FXS6_9BACT|nr:hypothetical protein CLV60_10918 [Dyadobacter jiangsuensis]